MSKPKVDPLEALEAKFHQMLKNSIRIWNACPGGACTEPHREMVAVYEECFRVVQRAQRKAKKERTR